MYNIGRSFAFPNSPTLRAGKAGVAREGCAPAINSLSHYYNYQILPPAFPSCPFKLIHTLTAFSLISFGGFLPLNRFDNLNMQNSIALAYIRIPFWLLVCLFGFWGLFYVISLRGFASRAPSREATPPKKEKQIKINSHREFKI